MTSKVNKLSAQLRDLIERAMKVELQIQNKRRAIAAELCPVKVGQRITNEDPLVSPPVVYEVSRISADPMDPTKYRLYGLKVMKNGSVKPKEIPLNTDVQWVTYVAPKPEPKPKSKLTKTEQAKIKKAAPKKAAKKKVAAKKNATPAAKKAA